MERVPIGAVFKELQAAENTDGESKWVRVWVKVWVRSESINTREREREREREQ
jgi:hypothetical protein